MTLAIIFIILYASVPPAIFMGAKFAKEQIKYALFGRRRSRTAIQHENKKEGFNQKLIKRIKFTLNDPRNKPIPYRIIFVLIYLIGAGLAIFGGLEENWEFLGLALMTQYISMIFSAITANSIVSRRDAVLERMLDFKKNKMKLVNREKGIFVTPEMEFKVMAWDEDLVTPTKLHLYMPTDFDILHVEGFLESFNLIFNSNGQWIADETDEQHDGFDFNAGVASIRVSPKLPSMAKWHERYLNPKYIHWSYFPLALGSENGVPVYNEEEDRFESVLGFSINSGQEKLSKKNGTKIGSEVVAAPMTLIAGGTGGGKSLVSTTVVKVVVDED